MIRLAVSARVLEQREDRSAEIILGLFKSSHEFKPGQIQLHNIGILKQARETFEDVEILADGIAINNVMQPPTVALLAEAACREYLSVMGEIWDTEYSIADLPVTMRGGKRYYYILIAGERRTRALRLLWEHGCTECNEAFGSEPVGTCYGRHKVGELGGDKIMVSLALHVTPYVAVALQIQENTYVPVKLAEEARGIARIWRGVRRVDPTFPKAAFARRINCKIGKVNNALRFVDLPFSIQKAVDDEIIAYGIAIELARLQAQLQLGEKGIEDWFVRAVVAGYSVEKFREIVGRHITHEQSGQGSLEDMMELSAVLDLRRRERRKVVATEMLRRLDENHAYFRRVNYLCEQKLLGQPDSPYSMRSVIKRFLRELDDLEVVASLVERRSRRARERGSRHLVRSLQNRFSQRLAVLGEEVE